MDRQTLSQNFAAPTPAESGVDGAQLPGSTSNINTATTPPLEGQFLERTFLGLVADSPNHFGGDLNAPMIGAMINSLSHEKESAKQQVIDLQKQVTALTSALHSKELQTVKLEEQLCEGQRTNLIQKVCTFLSPAAISIAIDLYKSNLSTTAFLIAAFGGLLLFTNFIPKRGAK